MNLNTYLLQWILKNSSIKILTILQTQGQLTMKPLKNSLHHWKLWKIVQEVKSISVAKRAC